MREGKDCRTRRKTDMLLLFMSMIPRSAGVDRGKTVGDVQCIRIVVFFKIRIIMSRLCFKLTGGGTGGEANVGGWSWAHG